MAVDVPPDGGRFQRHHISSHTFHRNLISAFPRKAQTGRHLLPTGRNQTFGTQLTTAEANLERSAIERDMMTRNTATDTSSSTTNTTPLGLAEARPLIGWRHSATWTYLIMLIASAVALGASLILSAETLQLARHPESALGCDLNSAVSCSAVARLTVRVRVSLLRVRLTPPRLRMRLSVLAFA